MSRQSKQINLRDREINEILDEDLKFYKEVLRREFKSARLMSETYSPPNTQEKQVAFQINRYFVKLQQEADIITNGLVNDQIEDTSALIAAYQELIGYLEVYAQYGTLGQRDLAVIENKFDAIAPQISQIATAATYLRWKQAPLLEQMDSLLDDRHYIKLRNVAAPAKPVEVPPIERRKTEPFTPLAGVKRELEVAATPERSVKREPAAAAPATPAGAPKTKPELRAYMERMSQEKLVQYVQQLNLYDKLKMKSGYISIPKMGVAEMRLVYALDTQTTPAAPAVVQENVYSEDNPMLVYGQDQPEPVSADPDTKDLVEKYFAPGSTYRPEIQPQLEGDGRRKTHGIMCGAGEAEDMMFGRPAGVKKALRLRPLDKKYVHYKTPDKVGEAGLTLEKRMLFLNQLDSKTVKDEMEINSTYTYKKAMSEKAKKLEKMKK
jgi:hypothetical protein